MLLFQTINVIFSVHLAEMDIGSMLHVLYEISMTLVNLLDLTGVNGLMCFPHRVSEWMSSVAQLLL